MSLAARHAQAQRPSIGGVCAFKKIIPALAPEDRDWLTDILGTDETSTAIASTLTEEGYPVKAHTVARHRRGACACA